MASESQAFCLMAACPVGGLTDGSTDCLHFSSAWAWMVGRDGTTSAGRMACEIGILPAAEAK